MSPISSLTATTLRFRLVLSRLAQNLYSTFAENLYPRLKSQEAKYGSAIVQFLQGVSRFLLSLAFTSILLGERCRQILDTWSGQPWRDYQRSRHQLAVPQPRSSIYPTQLGAYPKPTELINAIKRFSLEAAIVTVAFGILCRWLLEDWSGRPWKDHHGITKASHNMDLELT